MPAKDHVILAVGLEVDLEFSATLLDGQLLVTLHHLKLDLVLVDARNGVPRVNGDSHSRRFHSDADRIARGQNHLQCSAEVCHEKQTQQK